MRDATLHRLLAWSTASYPTGAFSYSHGLERAVEDGSVSSAETLRGYVAAVLAYGGGWTDAVFFVHAWRTARSARELKAVTELEGGLDAVTDLAAAWRATSEIALESHQQGAAFLEVTRAAWPHEQLDRFAQNRRGKAVPHSVAVAVACAIHDVPLDPALGAYLHAFASNLVSAGVRLAPLGQTSAQIAIARLTDTIAEVSERAKQAGLEDLGTAAMVIDLCSMKHETQYVRLFRS